MKADMRMDLKYCKGCGITLQNKSENKPGFVKNIFDQDYCTRCFKLKNYGKVMDCDFDIDAFKEKITKIIKSKNKMNRFFYVIDSLDIRGTRMLDIEEVLKESEVIICINKIDIFPKIKDKYKIYDYCIEEFKDCKIVNKQITLLSSKKLDTIDNLISILDSGNYDNYFIGMSNTGKSSLINACLKQQEMEEHILTSRYVNTTLDIINVDLDLDNKVFDTPGISVSKSILNSVHHEHWENFVFKKELKQFTFQIETNNSIVYENLAWIDIISNNSDRLSLHIWTNSNITVHRTKTDNVFNYLKKGSLIKPINDEFESIIYSFKKDIKSEIVISGLGWISFIPISDFKVRVTVPKINDKILTYITNNVI